MIIQYEHHGLTMSVQSELKGKNREHCLCYTCENFVPDCRKYNCPIAQKIYDACVENGIVTPVYECAKYEPEE